MLIVVDEPLNLVYAAESNQLGLVRSFGSGAGMAGCRPSQNHLGSSVMYIMTLRPLAFAAAISSPTKSRFVEQVPGILDGHGRAYPSRLWNVASTMYEACSCCAACTHLLASQPLA